MALAAQNLFDMANRNLKPSYRGHYPPKIGVSRDYLCLVYSSADPTTNYWVVDTWGIAGGWMVHKNVIAWMPLPNVPTKKQLESLYKKHLNVDE